MNYEEFVEKLRTGHVYTHGGGMHADDVLTTVLINQVCDKEGIARPEVHRLNGRADTTEYQQDNIVYDIGMGEFDHHQADNAVRDNGVPYAAFGKVFEVVGEQLYGDKAEAFSERFVQTIDECDNTQKTNPFSEMIKKMNPYWNEKVSTDDAFAQAVELSEDTLQERVNALEDPEADLTQLFGPEPQTEAERQTALETATREAKAKLIEAKKNATMIGRKYAVINLDVPGIPYPVIQNFVKDTNIAGYTFPARGGVTYKPLQHDDIDLKIPEEWKGAKEFDVEGLTFCHAAGISMSFDSLDHCNQALEVMADREHIHEYDGPLGKFTYDDREWNIDENENEYQNEDGEYETESYECLHYIGKEADGSKIHIPEGVVDCNDMFAGCEFLTKAPVIPDGVKDCSNMFWKCSSLTEAPTIPEGVKDCCGMFSYCESLTEAPTIPEGVKDCCGMFSYCESLTEAPTIPEGVEICQSMYEGCTSLTKATNIPESAKDCNDMFKDCRALEKAPVIPSGAECRYMFCGCESLKEAPAIPEGVTDCDHMFAWCESLIEPPVIPEDVKDCNNLFRGCRSITEAPVIPEGVINCHRMFEGCESLTETPVIPDGVKDCGGMFWGCKSITEAPIIPEGVKNCRYMFADCESLTETPVIPEGLKYNDKEGIFTGCTALEAMSHDDDER